MHTPRTALHASLISWATLLAVMAFCVPLAAQESAPSGSEQTPPAEPAARVAGGYTIDGEVTGEEMGISWKSSRFKIHGPGVPPDAEPPTHCYVGKGTIEGKPHLYIAYVCVDPNTDEIVDLYGKPEPPAPEPDASKESGGEKKPPKPPHRIECDDSIEIYLDTRGDRKSYYHMIVNTSGKQWSKQVADGDHSKDSRGEEWKVTPIIKTKINREAKRWTLEVLIPFEQLGYDKPGGEPQRGDDWAVNFTRNFRGQNNSGGYQSWFLIYEGGVNYHRPDNFGIFKW